MNSTTAIADDWWARDFACSGSELRPERARVQEHAGALLGNPGIWILVAGGAPLISLPSDQMKVMSHLARTWTAVDVAVPATLREQVTAVCTRPLDGIVGPAFIGYGTEESLDLRDARLARQVTSHRAIAELRAACAPDEWDHGGSDPHPERAFGVVSEANELLALSGYEVWNDSIAHISIVTHPRERGRKLGRAAVALAAEHASRAGLVPQYRTLEQNTASMRIARQLGFAKYGFSVYIRVGPG